MVKRFAALAAFFLLVLQPCDGVAVPEDFPRFHIPGHEQAMESLRSLYWLHYEPAGPLIPLWDEWMPMATLWPAREEGGALDAMRSRWTTALAGRGMNPDGYIHTHQHDGLAHAQGWPFPLWTQAGGIGWHFRGTGIGGYDGPPATTDGWVVEGADSQGIGEKGWELNLVSPGAAITSPTFSISTRIAPFLRLNWWASGLAGSDCYVEWTTDRNPNFSPDRRAYFSPATPEGASGASLPMGPDSAAEVNTSLVETRTMIPVSGIPGWEGNITGLRIGFGNQGQAKVVIKSFHTACDTRHNINNPNWIRGCHDYFLWTHDLTFLRNQMERIRKAMRFTMDEFQTRERKCVYTTWIGHEGRTGVVRTPDGGKKILRGEGIGSNYWDLLPFGGEDALASIYYYDALLDLAELEEAVLAHPEWGVSGGALAFEPTDLRNHAREVKDYGTQRFWNPETGRFGTVDLEGGFHDFGFTFLNNEAIYYDFATPEQAKTVRAWIDGERSVAGDTSSGEDIYHWRFGPRSTTKRNIEYYFWAWSNPEDIPWGGQVQDGGAVLGFSYHDLMAILRVDGPDKAWERLEQILAWFDETQAAGGYREYYKGRDGTLQGGNVAGGLGLDREFFESILVPQVMLYGFLGLRPTAEGVSLDPSLPKAWPSLEIDRIHLHDRVVAIKVEGKTVSVKENGTELPALRVTVPEGWTVR